jgi:heterodisulfide reductase subunit C
MKNFGYQLSKDRQIDLDKNDLSIAKYVASKEPSFKTCIACGSCTATCSAANFTDFNLRKLQTLLRRGEIDGLKKEISKCMFCGKCYVACPRGVNTRNMILKIREYFEKQTL